jgi:hypothetical protein
VLLQTFGRTERVALDRQDRVRAALEARAADRAAGATGQ